MPWKFFLSLVGGAVSLLMSSCLMAEDALQPVPMTPEERRMMEEDQIQKATQERCVVKARALYDSLIDNDRRVLQSFSDQHRGLAASSSPLSKTIQAGRFTEAQAILKHDYEVDDALAMRFILFAAYANNVEAACPKEEAGGTR